MIKIPKRGSTKFRPNLYLDFYVVQKVNSRLGDGSLSNLVQDLLIAWLDEESNDVSDLSKLRERLNELEPEKRKLDAEVAAITRELDLKLREKVGRVTKVIPLNNNGVIPR